MSLSERGSRKNPILQRAIIDQAWYKEQGDFSPIQGIEDALDCMSSGCYESQAQYIPQARIVLMRLVRVYLSTKPVEGANHE